MSTDLAVWFNCPPPASSFTVLIAKIGSIPVVSQSMVNPIVPVGAMTVSCAFLNPCRSANRNASDHVRVQADVKSSTNCFTLGRTSSWFSEVIAS